MKGGGGQVRIFDTVPGELWWEYPIVLRDYILRDNVLDVGSRTFSTERSHYLSCTQIIPNSRSFK